MLTDFEVRLMKSVNEEKRDAGTAYDQLFKEVSNIVTQIQKELSLHAKEQGKHREGWEFVGDLKNIKEYLEEVLNKLEGKIY